MASNRAKGVVLRPALMPAISDCSGASDLHENADGQVPEVEKGQQTRSALRVTAAILNHPIDGQFIMTRTPT